MNLLKSNLNGDYLTDVELAAFDCPESMSWRKSPELDSDHCWFRATRLRDKLEICPGKFETKHREKKFALGGIRTSASWILNCA